MTNGILFAFFLIFAHIWRFGVVDWVFGVGISVNGVWGLWCWAFLVFGVWALYIDIEELPWEKSFV